jgi:hypothetical protein
MTIIPPQCMTCIRYDADFAPYARCAAFPDGIPNEIWSNEVKHDKSYKGDGGLLYVELPTLS